MNNLFLIGCVISLTGCVGHYQQPAADAPRATLEAQKGDNNLIDGGAQSYWAFYDAHCQDTGQTGALGTVSPSSPGKNRFFIQTNRRIYLTALSAGVIERESFAKPMIRRSCLSVSSFVPETGATYQVTHTAPAWGCSVEIINLQTGQAPSTLIVEPVTKECGL